MGSFDVRHFIMLCLLELMLNVTGIFCLSGLLFMVLIPLICILLLSYWHMFSIIHQEGPSWSYSSWIYNYLYNRCLSSLKLRLRIPFKARCPRLYYYVIKFVSDLRQVRDFLRVFRVPPPIKLTDITEILLKVALNTITTKP